MKFWRLLFGGLKKMEADVIEIQALREKVKSLQQTVDMQLEVMEALQAENEKLKSKCERLKKKKDMKCVN